MRARIPAFVLTVVAALATTAAGPSHPVQAASTTGVMSYGSATPLGAPDPGKLNFPLVGVSSTSDGKGYWLVSSGGGVFTYGDAGFYGSSTGSGSWSPVVGMAPTPDGRGYWLVDARGNASSFGDAAAPTDLFNSPDAPVVGAVSAPGTQGFWMVGGDGGVFTSNGSAFYGSLGNTRLNAAIAGMAATPDGRGYWLVGRDGGVFCFGDARFFGSMGGRHLNAAVVGMEATSDGRGYWLVGADGGVFSFGDAVFRGSAGSDPVPVRSPVVGMAATPDGGGYWLVTTDRPMPYPATTPRVVAHCNENLRDPSYKPSQIVLACGDGNAWLDHLVWSSWTSTGAAARGEFVHNTCNPNCAQGSFVSAPATVRLGYPVDTGAGEEFAGLSYTTPDPTAPSGHRTYTEVAPTSP